jgi:hypothetical protein
LSSRNVDAAGTCCSTVNIIVGGGAALCTKMKEEWCDWCSVKVVTGFRVDRTCDARLHWHQYSLTSEFLKVPNMYLIELSSST